MRKAILIVFLQLFVSGICLAAGETLSKSFISFKQAEDIAIRNSHQIVSQRYVRDSARDDAFAQKVKRYPSLRFGADSSFVSKVGEIPTPIGGGTQQVGDHISWSTGPVVDWVVWDTGQITNQARSLEKVADSQDMNLDTVSRQVLLNARSAYIDVQLASEQVRLVKDALALARAQYSDVSEKKKVGTADQLDLTVAHQEVVDRERDLETALGQLGIAKRNLVAALGFDPEIENADSLDVEPIRNVLGALLPQADVPVEVESHPEVKALADQREASMLAAKSSSARHWPKVVMEGSATYQYPNLGQNETIQQNQATVGLNLPILDWGMISKETRSHMYQAYSAEEQKKQKIIDLSRDTSRIRERIGTLKELRVADVKAVKDAVEVARLIYDSYKAGRVIFLDVQRANVKALSAKVTSAQTDAELAIQISRLLALAGSDGEYR